MFNSIVKAAGGVGLSPPGSSVPSWFYGGGGTLHEPFKGAWQRGITEANAAGPNLLAYGPVYACTNLISSDISSLPLRVLQTDSDGIRSPFPRHPLWALLRKPNPYQTTKQFLRSYLASKLTTGNACILLFRDARGFPNEMYVLDPRKTQVLVDDTEGNIFYRLGRDALNNVNNELVVSSRDIIHDRCLTIWHPLVGVSPLFAASMDAMIGGRIQMNTETFFRNMSRTSGLLVTPNKIEATIAKRLQTEWENNYSGRGMGRVAVLSNGLDYKGIDQMSAVDSELIALLRWTKEEIAMIYRVPDYKLGSLNKVTYRNTEQMQRDYVNQCLMDHITDIEQCFNKAFELPEGVSVAFDLTQLYRAETDSRYKNLQTALQSGFMSINEARFSEDLPPVTGGEEPRVQMQDIPLSAATGENLLKPNTTPPAKAVEQPQQLLGFDEDEDDDDHEERGILSDDDLEQLSFGFMRNLRNGAFDAA